MVIVVLSPPTVMFDYVENCYNFSGTISPVLFEKVRT